MLQPLGREFGVSCGGTISQVWGAKIISGAMSLGFHHPLSLLECLDSYQFNLALCLPDPLQRDWTVHSHWCPCHQTGHWRQPKYCHSLHLMDSCHHHHPSSHNIFHHYQHPLGTCFILYSLSYQKCIHLLPYPGDVWAPWTFPFS